MKTGVLKPLMALIILVVIFVCCSTPRKSDTHQKPFQFSQDLWHEWQWYDQPLVLPGIDLGAFKPGHPDYGLIAFAKRSTAKKIAAELVSFPGYIYIVTEEGKNLNEIAIATIYGHHKLQFVIQPKENKIESRAGIQIISNSQIPQTEAQWFNLIKHSETNAPILKPDEQIKSNDSKGII